MMKFKFALLGAVLAASVSACSHAPVVQEFPNSASPADEVTRFDADIGAAQVEQVDVLAPDSFKDARKALADAHRSLDKQKDARATLHEVAVGRAYLDRARQFAQVSRTNLEDVANARQATLAAGAAASFGSELNRADERFMDVTSEIERNDLSNVAKRRGELQAEYLALELKTIQKTRLGPARDLIEQAKREDAEKFAPRTLAIAQKSLADATAFIIANRHDDSGIGTRATRATADADHLVKITRDAKAGKKLSAEDTAIELENRQKLVQVKQNQINDKQGQINEKSAELDAKQAQLGRKDSQLDAAKDANAVLAAGQDVLRADQAFTRSFDEARAQFTESEAEVYKQGDALVIRLRGLEFPASQAVLRGSNFPLLAKVQKVIEDFGKSAVVVEGHTDSQGGKAVNERLSNERAAAVRDYLVSNGGSSETNIQAVGYGYQKPLATNKTAAGRAQNRRVDVVIKPDRG